MFVIIYMLKLWKIKYFIQKYFLKMMNENKYVFIIRYVYLQ